MKDTRISQSIKRRLLNMANGDNKSYQQLVVRFLHERVLYRLGKSPYRERFILKGGSLLYAFEEFMARPTLDMDFMGTRIENDKDNIVEAFRTILQVDCPEDGIVFIPSSFTAEDITVDKKYPGVRVAVIATLGSYMQKLTMDIGFGDIVIPHPLNLDYPTLLTSLEEPSILAYSLETVVAEKFQTMIVRGRFNSRMKDYFDLYRIFLSYRLNDDIVLEAIKAVFLNRSTKYEEAEDFFSDEFGDDDLLNQQWNRYIEKLKLSLPSFADIHQRIATHLRPCWESLFL